MQERRHIRDLRITRRLGHPGQGEQVGAFPGIQLQRVGDCLQHLRGGTHRPSLFQPGVPGHADRGELGDAKRVTPSDDLLSDLVHI